jgi:hypothetical protein
LRCSRKAVLLEIQDAVREDSMSSEINLVAVGEFLVVVSSGDDLLGAWFEQHSLQTNKVSVLPGLLVTSVTHMLELRHVGAGDVHQRLITLNNPLINKRLHAEMVVLHSKVLKVSPRENKRAEVVINGLE